MSRAPRRWLMASDFKPESQLQLTQTERCRDADLTQSMLQLNKRAPTHPDGSSFVMLANSVTLTKACAAVPVCDCEQCKYCHQKGRRRCSQLREETWRQEHDTEVQPQQGGVQHFSMQLYSLCPHIHIDRGCNSRWYLMHVFLLACCNWNQPL